MPLGHPELVRMLRRSEQLIAETVTADFLTRHPDWIARYGDLARVRGVEDARFHVKYLSGAIESDSPAAFADYVRWTTRVLESRGIDRAFLRENLLQVQDAAAPLLSPANVEVMARFISAGLEPRDDLEPPTVAEHPLTTTRNMFVQTILKGDRRAALTVATETLRDGVGIQDLYADVFQDGLREVGRLWETNVITVAQEHMATAVTQYVMAKVFDRIEPPEMARGTAVITGEPGEFHHIGPLMIADMLEANGWRVQFLGSNLPIPAIVAAIKDARPDVLGVSVTMLFNLHEAARLIELVRALGDPMRIVVGGAAFRVANDWRRTGADAYAPDLKGAVALLCSELPS
jgi:methanogenic corrinoid protein MtbC1